MRNTNMTPEFDEAGHKKVCKSTGDTLESSFFNSSASDIIDEMKSLIEDHGDEVTIELDIDSEYPEDTKYNIYTSRYETDKERDDRLAREEKWRKYDEQREIDRKKNQEETARRVEQWEIETYERLKKKFEGK